MKTRYMCPSCDSPTHQKVEGQFICELCEWDCSKGTPETEGSGISFAPVLLKQDKGTTHSVGVPQPQNPSMAVLHHQFLVENGDKLFMEELNKFRSYGFEPRIAKLAILTYHAFIKFPWFVESFKPTIPQAGEHITGTWFGVKIKVDLRWDGEEIVFYDRDPGKNTPLDIAVSISEESSTPLPN